MAVDPEQDELSGGATREPVRLPRVVSVLAGLVALATVGFLASRPGPDPAAMDGAAPTSSASSRADLFSPVPGPGSQSRVGLPLAAGPLDIDGRPCATTVRRTLTVQFALVNQSVSRVTVVSASGSLPIGGREPAETRLPADVVCGTRVERGTSLVLEPGQRVPVSLRFALPAECPAPYPVTVAVELIGRFETPLHQELTVLPDRGGYDFTTCEHQRTR